MAVVEKHCQLSFQAPTCTDDRFTLPHNFIYDIPLQPRGVTKEFNTLESYPAFKSPGLISSMMMPYSEPMDFNFENIRKDPLQNILKEKKEYLKQLRTRLSVIAGKSRLTQQIEAGKNIDDAPSSSKDFVVGDAQMIKLAEWVERDPYPYFNGSHLWLAVGGSLKYLDLSTHSVLVAPDGKNFDKIKIISLNLENTRRHNTPCLTVECTPGERIYQVVTSKKKKRGIIGIRTLRGFNVLGLKPEDESFKCRKLIEVSEPENVLVCIDVSSNGGGAVCTLDKVNSVKIYDISAGKCVTDERIRVPPNRSEEPEARFVQYSNQPSIIYIANKRKLFLKDLREPFQTSGTTFNVYDAYYGCEELSVMAPSAVSDCLYCASSHHSFALDPRKGWIKRWSHGLDDVPLYINAGITEPFKELVVTGNLEIGSSTGIIQPWKQVDDDILPSYCSTPFLLPSVRDTALWANSKGFWLEPGIGKRIESSLCGVAVVPRKSGSGCTLFTANAIGDVFSMDLTPDESADLDSFKVHKTSQLSGNAVTRIEEWQRNHMDHVRKSTSELQCASLEDRYFMCSIIKHHLNVDAVARSRAFEWRNSFSSVHQRPKGAHRVTKLKPLRESRLKDLGTHKDWLVNEILPIWDMDLLIDEARQVDPRIFKKPSKRKRKPVPGSDSSSDSE